MSIIKMIFFAAFISGIGIGAALAENKLTISTGEKDNWISITSSEGNEKAIPLDYEKFLLSLYNLGTLKTVPFKVTSEKTLEEILRKQGLYYGDFFPVGIDAALCDVNPKHCNRTKRVAIGDRMNLTNHAGGVVKSKGIWTIGKGDTVNLPAFVVKKFITFGEETKPMDKSVTEIIAAKEFDCMKDYGAPCIDIIKKLNGAVPSDALETGKEAKLILPYYRIQIDALVPDRPDDCAASSTTCSKIFAPVQAGQDWKNSVNEAVDGIEAFHLEQMSYTAEPGYEAQHNLFELIRHPFSMKDDLAAGFKSPVKIGVVDQWVDINHCDLADQFKSSPVENAPDYRRAQTCGEHKDRLGKQDHGTHVTGLIFAGLNGKAIVGLNPHAKLIYMQIPADRLRDPRQVLAAVEDIFKKIMWADVVNFSWSYSPPGGHDFIGELIDRFSNSQLFVVAAGNSKKDLNLICDKRPACLVSANVISVVGLDRSLDTPQLWSLGDGKGSNYGYQMDIAAIAQDVTSTARGNFIGELSGTSQAAPQVTAAASFLISDYLTLRRGAGPPILPPIQIKNRLMYTADVFPHLRDKVFSGRLNVSRAMKVNKDIVVVDEGGRKVSYEGRVLMFVKRGRDPLDCAEGIESNCSITEVICDHGTQKKMILPISGLRRFLKVEESGYYTAFYNKDRERRDSKLKRKTDCSLSTLTAQMVLKVDNGSTKVFQVKQIIDYTSAMY